MALYVFKCDSCDKVFELFVPMEKRDEGRNCPICGARLRREVSKGVDFHMKDVSRFFDGKRYGR